MPLTDWKLVVTATDGANGGQDTFGDADNHISSGSAYDIADGEPLSAYCKILVTIGGGGDDTVFYATSDAATPDYSDATNVILQTAVYADATLVPGVVLELPLPTNGLALNNMSLALVGTGTTGEWYGWYGPRGQKQTGPADAIGTTATEAV
jgi:hypothetical protein